MKSMKLQFLGTYAELQNEVLLTGIAGAWRDLGNHKQYRAGNGAILNWWQSTGKMSFQGPELEAAEFEAKLFCVQRAMTKLQAVARSFRRNCWAGLPPKRLIGSVLL